MTEPGPLSALPSSPVEAAQVIARRLSEQADLYAQLVVMGQRQLDLIRSNDTDSLLTLLGQRQRLLDQITALNRGLGPLQAILDAQPEAISPEHRAGLRELSERIGNLVREIQSLDEAGRSALTAGRDGVRHELDLVARARRAAGAYASAPRVVTPQYQDRSG